MQSWRERGIGFLFPEESDAWLAVLRAGMGLQVILYAFSLRKDWHYLLAGTGGGLISRNLSEAILSLESALIPRLGWLVAAGGRAGLREETVLAIVWGCLLCAGFFLLTGLFSRPAAVVAWLLHLSAVKSGDLVSYGMDNFTSIGLFYLMLSPLPDRWSVDWRWRPRTQDPQLLGFFRRVLQVHLCLIYFFGGLAKCLGAGWWNGSNLWRALIRPPFNIISPEILIQWKYAFLIGGIFICLLEISYPIFIWPKRTRPVWLISVVLMHVGVGLTMGMYLFSLIMIILNLSAFGPGLFERQEAKVVPPEQESTA
jgi:hypothetical protein